MKRLLTLTLFLGIVWGQRVTKGTGLELDDISNFQVLCESPNSDGEKIGLSKESIEAKVKLALRGNGTPSKGKIGSPIFYINIFVREDKTISGRSLGYSVSIKMYLLRNLKYQVLSPDLSEVKEYRVSSPSWWPPAYHLPLSSSNAKSKIMDNLLELVDQFSIALLEANEK